MVPVGWYTGVRHAPLQMVPPLRHGCDERSGHSPKAEPPWVVFVALPRMGVAVCVNAVVGTMAARLRVLQSFGGGRHQDPLRRLRHAAQTLLGAVACDSAGTMLKGELSRGSGSPEEMIA